MVQLFSDQVRDEGATSAWLRAAQDLPTSAAAERARDNGRVGQSLGEPPRLADRLMGILGVIGGVALLAAFIVTIAPDVNVVRVFLMLVGSLALVIGTHRHQRVLAPTVSSITTAAAVAALTWMLVMEVLLIGRQQPVFGGIFGWVFFWASIAWWATSAIFWLAAARIGAVTRLGAGLSAVGSVLSVLGIDRLGLANDQTWSNIALAGLAMVAIGAILVGLDLVTRRRNLAPT
jgi:hypothetical protein